MLWVGVRVGVCEGMVGGHVGMCEGGTCGRGGKKCMGRVCRHEGGCAA